MIRRLRLKFTLLLMGSLFALFTVIVTSMNVINYCAVVIGFMAVSLSIM